MRFKSLLWLLPALLATGCAHRPADAPPAAFEPAPPGVADSSKALSPFGSREVTAPSRKADVVIPAGTVLRVRLSHHVDTARNRAGDHFTAILDAPLLDGTHVTIPKGTLFTGHLAAAKPSGRLRGRAVLELTLDSFELDGITRQVTTSAVSRVSDGHKRRNTGLIGGAAGVGALLGAIAGGAKGALIGAGAGVAAGTAGAAATGRRNVRLPAESLLVFTLKRPVLL